MADIVIIIGNGFDLNIGLKTSYSDFIGSLQFQELIDDGNSLAAHLNSKFELQNWIDIENELKTYSNGVFKNDNRMVFKAEYKNLCNALCNYINKIDYTTINKKSVAFSFIKEIHREEHEITIYDFNYTESVKKIIEDIGVENNITSIKVHGTAMNNDIIFGVEDRAHINKDDSFLYKSASQHYNSNVNIEKELEQANHIVVIGHSLGESDHFYFGNFFQTQAMPNSKAKNMTFTYHTEDGWDGLMKQLMSLSRTNLSSLKSLNNIHYKDI